MSDRPGLRVSDAQREQVASELREHFAAGRLDSDELAARLESTYAARTEAALSVIKTDLPTLPATGADQRADLALRRRAIQRRILPESGGGLRAFAICLTVWLATGASGYFWPIWVLLAVIAPLVSGGWSLYGPGADLDQLEQDHGRRERHREARRQEELERRSLPSGENAAE